MSDEWIPITTAEQLVRHYLRHDVSAQEIEERLQGQPLWYLASIGERSACKQLLTRRRLYDQAVAAILAAGEYPSAEKVATKTGKDERTVRRWQSGES